MKISSPKINLIKGKCWNCYIYYSSVNIQCLFISDKFITSEHQKKMVSNHNYTVLSFNCIGNSSWADVASIHLSIPADYRGFRSWCESNEVGGGKT